MRRVDRGDVSRGGGLIGDMRERWVDRSDVEVGG